MGTVDYKNGIDSREQFERDMDAAIADAEPMDADSLRLVRALLPVCNAWLGMMNRNPNSYAPEDVMIAFCTASTSVFATVVASMTECTDHPEAIRQAQNMISGMLMETADQIEAAGARKQ